MKKHALVFALSTTVFLSGCATNLPGTFPNSGVFKSPYVKEVQPSDIVGKWIAIANGRIYNNLDIEIANKNPDNPCDPPKIELNITINSGDITNACWDLNTSTLSFLRTVDQSHKPDTIDIIQQFTGHLMQYPKSANPRKDSKWRIAGTFAHTNTNTKVFPTSGWYATRPRKKDLKN